MTKRVTNDQVAIAWTQGLPAQNHRGSFYTDGNKIYSYELQIGDTSEVGAKIVRDYTAKGSYGFRSQTTSCHVGLLRYIHGVDQQPIVI
tara:strand:- start:332 stop:598 length:267 start_codon:yes stop_codon:yes gene_type:complete